MSKRRLSRRGDSRLPHLFPFISSRHISKCGPAGGGLRNIAFALSSALALVLLLLQMTAAQEKPPEKSDGALLRGTVHDASGKLMPDAHVVLSGKSLRAPRETSTNASGTFTFSDVPFGTFTLMANSGMLRSATVSLIVSTTSEQSPVNLVLGTSDAGRSASAEGSNNASQAMQFADNPDFAIAAVTDWTAAGGHGSDASLRTSEALTRDAVKLGSKDAPPATTRSTDGSGGATKDGDLHRMKGELDEKSGDPLSAVHEFQQAASEDPSESNYFAWGSELLIHRAVWQAKEVFDAGVRLYPQSARMLAARGAALFAGALYDQAALDLCRASDLNPESVEPYLFMGKIEIASPNPLPCVVSKLARFQTLQGKNPLANYYYAMALKKQQDQAENPHNTERVKDLLTQAVTLDPKCGEAHLELGNLSAQKKQWDQAIGHYLSAIQANPELNEAHYRLGVAYQHTGENAKAAEQFQLHDKIAREQAVEIQRQREAVKQFQVVLPDHK